MDTLHIQWVTGFMDIYMKEFLPCSKQKFNKLLKVIELDWKHRDELREKLKVHFQNMIPESEAEWKRHSKEYLDHRQKAVDMETQIKTRKYPNGVMIPSGKIKEMRNELNTIKMAASSALASVKRCKSDTNKYQELLKLL